MPAASPPPSPLRRLRRRLVVVLIVYCVGGAVSQKLLPGVDEIIPFFGWSLFSRVPPVGSRYELMIHRHQGRAVAPPAAFLRAPERMVKGDRYLAHKVIAKLGAALDEGDGAEAERLRRLLERNYLAGAVEYEVVFESYDPLVKWRTGESLERRGLGRFATRRRAP